MLGLRLPFSGSEAWGSSWCVCAVKVKVRVMSRIWVMEVGFVVGARVGLRFESVLGVERQSCLFRARVVVVVLVCVCVFFLGECYMVLGHDNTCGRFLFRICDRVQVRFWKAQLSFTGVCG